MNAESKELLAMVGDAALAAQFAITVPVFSIGLKGFISGMRVLQKRRLETLRRILEKKLANNNINLSGVNRVDPSVVANYIRIITNDALETDSLDKINFLANTYVHGLLTSFTTEDQIFIYLDLCRRMTHLHIVLLRDIYVNREELAPMNKLQDVFDFLRSNNSSITEKDLFRFVFFDLENFGLIRLSKDFLDFGSRGGYTKSDEGISEFGTTSIGLGFIDFLELYPKEE